MRAPNISLFSRVIETRTRAPNISLFSSVIGGPLRAPNFIVSTGYRRTQ